MNSSSYDIVIPVRGEKQGGSGYVSLLDENLKSCQHVVVYPVSGGKYINVVAVVHEVFKEGTEWTGPSSVQVDQAEFLNCFEGWEEDLRALIYVRSTPDGSLDKHS